MIQQRLMPIKLERMESKLTARSGLFLHAEFMEVFGVDDLIQQSMPKPESGRGFKALTFIKPLSMTLYGGGQSIEDMKEIREDKALRKALGISTVPSPSAEGDWLRRMAKKGGIKGIEMVNKKVAHKIILKDRRKSYTLIVDPTIIEAEKKQAHMTYVGVKGYRPVIAVLKELDIAIAYEFPVCRQAGKKGATMEVGLR